MTAIYIADRRVLALGQPQLSETVLESCYHAEIVDSKKKVNINIHIIYGTQEHICIKDAN